MFKKVVSLCIVIITCLFLIQCSSSNKTASKYNNKILGLWERVGDNRAGLVVKVEQLSKQDSYLGKIVYTTKPVPKYEIDDILWQNIQGINSTQWTGYILGKQDTFFSGIVSSTYEAKFLLINDNLLEIYTDGQTQKWIRTNESAFKESYYE